MVSPLKKVFVRTPTTVGEFVADGHWREPDRDLLPLQHAEFVELLRGFGAEVLLVGGHAEVSHGAGRVSGAVALHGG